MVEVVLEELLQVLEEDLVLLLLMKLKVELVDLVEV